MNSVFVYVVSAILAYLIGAIPTAYLVVKQLTGQDIREIGSGNVGATNVKRAAGFKPFLFVLICDFLKGGIPVGISMVLFPTLLWLHVMVALMSVVGHSKSIYLGFAGGKSAATGLGGVLVLAPLQGLLLGLTAYVVTRLSQRMSIGTISACVLAPPLLWFCHVPLPYLLYTSFAALYVIFLHKANIIRLCQGTENRI